MYKCVCVPKFINDQPIWFQENLQNGCLIPNGLYFKLIFFYVSNRDNSLNTGIKTEKFDLEQIFAIAISLSYLKLTLSNTYMG